MKINLLAALLLLVFSTKSKKVYSVYAFGTETMPMFSSALHSRYCIQTNHIGLHMGNADPSYALELYYLFIYKSILVS
jgi:hypothetical protein